MKTSVVVFLFCICLFVFGGLAAAWAHADPIVITYSGSETTITLSPGTYNITAYGAQGGAPAAWERRSRANFTSRDKRH